jgi:hypothetical protein
LKLFSRFFLLFQNPIFLVAIEIWETVKITLLILPRDAALRLLRKRRLAYFCLGTKILFDQAFGRQICDPSKFSLLSFSPVKFWMLIKVVLSFGKLRGTELLDVKFLVKGKLRFA